jgi:hypothetical protein
MTFDEYLEKAGENDMQEAFEMAWNKLSDDEKFFLWFLVGDVGTPLGVLSDEEKGAEDEC